MSDTTVYKGLYIYVLQVPEKNLWRPIWDRMGWTTNPLDVYSVLQKSEDPCHDKKALVCDASSLVCKTFVRSF